ncbi:MAG: NAD(P)H-dependent oxidoreductase subunit E [Proteobacteria bacterium]|nr:NAD(P)H-dependent oxidoreductase subunit E [Pseudomonadota bacterium]
MKKAEVDKIINSYGADRSQVIAIMNEVQDEERYLPEETLKHIAQRLKLPLAQLYSISTFYRVFSLVPKGKHQCTVCMGTACHVRGAERVLSELERVLKVKAGETTKDKQFSLDTVNCVGACALGPIVIMDGEYHGQVTAAKARNVLKKPEAK